MSDRRGPELVRLEVDGPIAVITNNRPEQAQRHERRDGPAAVGGVWPRCTTRRELRAIVWRGEGRSFSSGRDTDQLGLRVEDISDLEFIERGHRPTQMFLTMPCPIICALKGWVIGGRVRTGPALRHPGGRRGHPDDAARGGPRGDPRLGRDGPALPDGRARGGRRPGAHRAGHGRRGGAPARGRQPPGGRRDELER